MKQTPKFLLPLLLASLAALQGCSSVYRDTVSAPTEQEIAAAKLMEPDPVLRQGEFHMQRVNEGSTVRIEPKIKLKHPELPPFDVAYVSQPVEDILIELANTARESIVIPSSIRGKTITVIHSGSDFQGMLNIVLSKIGYHYNYIDGVWYITRYPVRTYHLEVSQSERSGSLSSLIEPGISKSDAENTTSTATGVELNTDYTDKIWEQVNNTLTRLIQVDSDVQTGGSRPQQRSNQQSTSDNTGVTGGFSGSGGLVGAESLANQVQLLAPPSLDGSQPAGGGKVLGGQLMPSGGVRPNHLPLPEGTDHLSADDMAEPFYEVTKSAGLITVRAAPEAHRLIETYLEQVQSALLRQIYVEARIVALVRDKLSDRGANLSVDAKDPNILSRGLLANLGFRATSPVTAGSEQGGFINFTSTTGNLALVMQMLNTLGDVYTISSPSLLARNNQLSRVAITQQIGYPETTVQTNTNASGNVVIGQRTDEAKFRNAGTVFSVLPFIGRNKVQMRMRLSIANQSGEVEIRTSVGTTDPVVNTVPELSTNLIDQDFVMDYGRVHAVGGIVQDNTSISRNYTPGFSQIPGMREVFNRAQNRKQNTEFLVLMRISRA